MEGDADEAAGEVTRKLLEWMAECIPMHKVRARKSTHPWLTEEVLQKVLAKKEAAGTEREREATEACSEAIRKAYYSYVQRVREEL